MTRGILIAGNESPLFSAVGAEASRRVERWAGALIPHGLGTEQPWVRPEDRDQSVSSESGKTSPAYLDWNSASPVSTRTLVLAAQNELRSIDEAVLVCVPPAYRRPPEELVPVDIDRIVNCNIKGWFFLVRELTGIFKRRRADQMNPGGSSTGSSAGTLALVLKDISADTRDDLPDLAGPAIAAAFRSFAQGLLVSTANAPYTVMGFSSSDPSQESAFAAYIFKIIEEGKRNAGKWHKHGRQGFFGR
jgi:NAD(P)-dependent dehydrogenase (short-subunit alcohol dehydrogenase family)